MINLDDYALDETSKSIIDIYDINDDREMLYTLEEYKFVESYGFVNALNRTMELPEVDLDNNQDTPKIYHLAKAMPADEYREVMKKYGVIIEKDAEANLTIIAPILTNLDLISLLLAIDDNVAYFKWVTPYNFDILAGREIQYNAELMYRRMIQECVKINATDLHITVEHVNKEPVYLAKYRQDGFLYDLDLFKLNKVLNEEIVNQVVDKMTNKSSIDLEISKGIVANVPNVLGDNKTELRLSANKVRGGFECVARIQNVKTVSLTIDKLGFPSYVQEALMKMSKKRTGITLFTGPIRTGKNTSAFALANELVKYPIKIKSFESPIEALMPFPQVDYMDEPEQLADAIRLAKKQDLNVAFINEIPSKDVAFGVQDLVNSSVYVVTTLHIDRIWHLPYKLYEYYGDSYRNIISQINCVFNQKMFPLLCPHCVTSKLTDDLEDHELVHILKKHNVNRVGVSTGCEHCLTTNPNTLGIAHGHNQPFVEYLIFDDELKSELLSTTSVHEMEAVIKQNIRRENRTLEEEICKAIQDKKIGADALYALM